MSHFINLEKAVDMTSRYRAHREGVLTSDYQDQNMLALSETFDRVAIDALLAQTGCTKLRIYYGMDEALNIHAVLVAANEDDADILPAATNSGEEKEHDGIILEMSNRCPPLCPPSSPLNEP